jgi:hypothetical protein
MNIQHVVLAVLIAGVPGYASVTTYTSNSAWLQATNSGGNILTEHFAGPALTMPGLTVSTVSGISSSGFQPGDGKIANGMWNDCVGNSCPAAFDSTTWSLNKPMYAFGAMFNSVGIGGLEFGLNTASAGPVIQLPASQNPGNPTQYSGFFGFVSTEPFTSVFVSTAFLVPGTSSTNYGMSDLQISTTDPVPEPATVWFMLAAIPLGVFAVRRRRVSSRVSQNQ